MPGNLMRWRIGLPSTAGFAADGSLKLDSWRDAKQGRMQRPDKLRNALVAKQYSENVKCAPSEISQILEERDHTISLAS